VLDDRRDRADRERDRGPDHRRADDRGRPDRGIWGVPDELGLLSQLGAAGRIAPA
jgi:hypothetical protein